MNMKQTFTQIFTTNIKRIFTQRFTTTIKHTQTQRHLSGNLLLVQEESSKEHHGNSHRCQEREGHVDGARHTRQEIAWGNNLQILATHGRFTSRNKLHFFLVLRGCKSPTHPYWACWKNIKIITGIVIYPIFDTTSRIS